MSEKLPYKITRRDLIRAASVGAAAMGAEMAALGMQQKPPIKIDQSKIGRTTTVSGSLWTAYRDAAVKGALQSVNLWKLQATLNDVKIFAVSAVGGPGCLHGPSLAPNMKASMLKDNVPADVAEAWSQAVADAWKGWQGAVTVPGLPWYPAFAAFPGPMAPPMPNIPTPVATLASGGVGLMSPGLLAQSIKSKLGAQANNPDADKAIQDFATWFGVSFFAFLGGMVTLVLGKGPVPTFAPPYVPVGPVVNGDNIPNPGIFLTAPFGIPFVPTATVASNFNDDVKTAHARLESGTVRTIGNDATIIGTASIWQTSSPNTRLVVKNGAVMLSRAGAKPTRPLENAINPDLKIGGGTPWAGLKGEGTLEISAPGVSLSVPGGVVDLLADGSLAFGGGQVTYKGVSIALTPAAPSPVPVPVPNVDVPNPGGLLGRNPGGNPTPPPPIPVSGIQGGQIQLAGTINYGSVAASVALQLSAAGARGSGSVNAFGHVFDLTFQESAGRLGASGQWSGQDTAWTKLPVVQSVEFRVQSPRVSVSMLGPNFTATFAPGSVQVRSVAKKPNGDPWTSAELRPNPISIGTKGELSVPLPSLPSVSDIFKASRDAAIQAANLIPNADARNAALAVAQANNPAPPSLPTSLPALNTRIGALMG